MDERVPSRWRMLWATLAVVLVIVVVWKMIDWRMRPPPPTISPAQAAEAPR